jgi:UPF0716 protein FxsA
MLRLIGLLLLIPLIDALLLVVATAYLGWQLVVLLVVLTALVGLLLVRVEGRHTLAKIQRKVARGEAPTDELLDGAFLIAAGALFLTPGVVTDLVALVLALPPTRYPVRAVVKTRVLRPYVDARTGGFATGRVYTAGFPGDEGRGDAGGAGASQGDHRPPGSGGDATIDVGNDEYEIDDADPDDRSGADGPER